MQSMYNRGKTDKYRGLLAFFLKNFCPCVFGYRIVTRSTIGFKITMCSGTTCMYNSFWYFFPVKMTDFLNVIVILKCGGTTVSNRSDVLIIGDRVPLSGR